MRPAWLSGTVPVQAVAVLHVPLWPLFQLLSVIEFPCPRQCHDKFGYDLQLFLKRPFR